MSKFYKEAKQDIFEELDSGILQITIWKDYYSELEHSLESLEIIKTIHHQNHKKICVLGDIRGLKGSSKESRASVRQTGDLDPNKHVAALAILIQSPVSKLVGNFLIKFNKPSFPLRLFTKKEEAIKFLEQYQK